MEASANEKFIKIQNTENYSITVLVSKTGGLNDGLWWLWVIIDDGCWWLLIIDCEDYFYDDHDDVLWWRIMMTYFDDDFGKQEREQDFDDDLGV